MQNITDINLLNKMKLNGSLLILFGGEHCAVCQSLHPRLESAIEKQFPDMRCVYVDCNKSPEICAQHSVFSLPVVKAYIDGMIIADEFGAFSIKKLMQTIDRPYTMWKKSI